MAQRTQHTSGQGINPPKKFTVSVEMKNLDMPYGLVEGAQGMMTPNGNLAVSFYSETTRSKEKLTASSPVNVLDDGSAKSQANLPEPFGLDKGEMEIVRVVEANLIFTEKSLQLIINWLQQKHDEIIKNKEV